jgi:hypothetical protein
MRARLPYDWTNPATLAANQAGKLTDEQWKLVGEPVHWGCLLLASAMVIAAVTGLALAAARNGNFAGFLFVAFPLVIVVALVGVNRARGQARDDAVAGRIEQAQGQVTWDGVRYVAEVPGRRLRPLRRYAAPAPGPYDFFYLARSGVLLAAEPVRRAVPPVPGSDLARRELVEALARTVRFSPEDLAANRAGRLSSAQRRRLVVDTVDTFFGTLGGVAGALVLVLGGLAVAAYTLAPSNFPGQTAAVRGLLQRQPVSLSPLLGGALAVLVVGGVAAFLAARPVFHDACDGRVVAIDGAVDAEAGVIRAATVYYYVVRTTREDGARRPLRFVVAPLAYRALVGGKPYRLYYLPHLHTLLSIEPLASPISPVS